MDEDRQMEKDLDAVNWQKKRGKSEVRISTALKLTEKQILGSIRCWPTFMTIATYLVSEQSKKARSFQIGIFTVFLVVSFLALMKSVVDVAPVTFVKLASDSVGITDFRLTPNLQLAAAPMKDGNTNFL